MNKILIILQIMTLIFVGFIFVKSNEQQDKIYLLTRTTNGMGIALQEVMQECIDFSVVR